MKHSTFFLCILFIGFIESENNGVAVISLRHDLNEFFYAMKKVKNMLDFRKNILTNGKNDDECYEHFEKYKVSKFIKEKWGQYFANDHFCTPLSM